MDAIGVYRAQIREFFERSRGEKRYKSLLLAIPPPRRIVIDIGDIRRFNKDLSLALQENAISLLPAFEEIAQEYTQTFVSVGISGVLHGEKVTPRTLLSNYIGKMVSIKGIITSASIVRPKIKKSVHYIQASNSFVSKEYRDSCTLSILPPTTTAIPKQSLDGNPLELEYGLSEYISHQTITLQEMPELSLPGQMPRAISIVLENDLAGLVKPGDRVRVYGTYKCVSNLKSTQDTLKTTVIANNIEILNKKEEKKTSPEAIQSILAAEGIDGIVKYIAPSIYGHTAIKKAILLMMIGGKAIQTSTGGSIRGDINILLVGDPGIAKSQLLRYVLDISPLSVGTTGRGASGVGLTAAIVSDPDTGSRKIEAGAMVLADTGIVCIDEFDKMDDTERAAIHEAMEQQTVTITKGGIYITLNARCSVLAAANPVSGQYRSNLSPRENIRLPESILTRFDLIYILEDTLKYDSEIAEHVLDMRMGRKGSINELSREEIRSYIEAAKAINPELSEDAVKHISVEYMRIREEGEKNKTSLCRNVTARLLESIIRLSTAHAKARLSSVIELDDAVAAVEILESTLWRKSVRIREKKAQNQESLHSILYSYRENNPNDRIVSIEKIASLCEVSKESVIEGLMEFEKEEIIKIVDGMIIFP
ncbi:DNA replication licensing factor MCM3 [Nematocida major]|uniref:DNA replication licensing factor MCM3 n=1 Tax=Nematocida major TaxID=1912982 RepID=UPI00200853A4|nr:DNA replication licensing factor MCM3 [Nematocida major]KAH9385248.1 DNA replication licensing factor MCM3 [Nematocida major]